MLDRVISPSIDCCIPFIVDMNFYKSAALALDHLEKHQGSVKGSLSAAGIQGTGGETKRILACERTSSHDSEKCRKLIVASSAS